MQNSDYFFRGLTKKLSSVENADHFVENNSIHLEQVEFSKLINTHVAYLPMQPFWSIGIP